jgi:acyl carrier protein
VADYALMSCFSIITESGRKQRKLDRVFAGREPLGDHRLWELYFRQYGVASDTVARIRRILAEILQADLSRVRDTDDFSKELAFFWDFDSLADVQIVEALEEQFSITITDADAEAMKTLRDIVLGVHAKITKPSAFA